MIGLKEALYVLSLVRPLWKQGLFLFVLSLCVSIISTLMPLSIKVLFDFILTERPISDTSSLFLNLPLIEGLSCSVELLAIAFTLAGVAMIALSVFNQYMVVAFQQKAIFLIQSKLFEHVLRFPIPFFKKTDHGYMIARLSDDIQVLEGFFSESLPYTTGRVLSILGVIVILLMLNTTLTAVLLVFTPLYLLLSRSITTRLRSTALQERESYARMLQSMKDSLDGVETLKVQTAESSAIERLSSQTRSLLNLRKKRMLLSALSMNTIRAFQILLAGVLMIYGYYEIKKGNMSIGDFATFGYYTLFLSTSLTQLAVFHTMLQSVAVVAIRLRELFKQATEDTRGKLRPLPLRGEIAFREVTFSYNRDKPLLRNINLHIRPSEVVLIKGPTGSGKTTLVNLLLRFIEPLSGQILIDGHNLSDIDLHWLRRQIAVHTQDVYLFNDTIYNNIKFARAEASRKEVIQAAKQAGIHEEIVSLPEGYETPVGDRGCRLSTGQRQRIALARVLLRNPRVLILDEPTSSLDPQTELQIIESLKGILPGRTVIIVTHRESLSVLADRRFELKNGHLREVP